MSIFDLEGTPITPEYLLDRGFLMTYDEPHLKEFSLNVFIVDDSIGRMHKIPCIVSYDNSCWKVSHLPMFGGVKIETVQDLNCWIESAKLKYKRSYELYEKVKRKNGYCVVIG